MSELTSILDRKFQLLKEILQEMGSVVVAMSGGLDSVLLARVAYDVLGDQALAVTADSPSLPRRELQEAIRIARQIGIRHEIIQTDEFANPHYAANPSDRCFFCKDELFNQLDLIAKKYQSRWVCFGENVDDQSDFRPGSQAASMHAVRAPLREAGFGKIEIRALAQELGLPIWEKPASACLSSRIPYGMKITPEKLAQVEAAEDYLWSIGYRQVRVRHHGEIARIEVPPGQLSRIAANAEEISQQLKKLGFTFVTLDLTGYRRGSLNESLNLGAKEGIITNK